MGLFEFFLTWIKPPPGDALTRLPQAFTFVLDFCIAQ